ncbi:NAD(P)-binding protein [Fistulina hepatica ATCC 64428]|nr:NAD(P)-binding protein [Fistulina hepatica ATCC 64428]
MLLQLTASARSLRGSSILKNSTRCSKLFSTSSVWRDRAIIYNATGNPSEVLRTVTYPSLPPPSFKTINVQYVLSPINPADVNVIEGVYPSKPGPDASLQRLSGTEDPVFVGGNEGLARVTDMGSDVTGLRVGDRVVVLKPQSGTWATSCNLAPTDVVLLPESGLSDVTGAMATVNPPTAYNMLHEFVKLKKGDFIVQNGANSTVGQLVIQMADILGYKTINFVRDRPDFPQLQAQLQALGADYVYTYDQLMEKTFHRKFKALMQDKHDGKLPLLALNCVGGPATTAMVRLLALDGHILTYGAMSRQPLELPTSLFIFKNLTAHGFWQSNWYANRNRIAKEVLFERIADMNLRAPEHEIVRIPASVSDEEATQRVRKLFSDMAKGMYGKKILLNLE